MSVVTLKGHIEIPEEDLAAVVAELPNHIDLTRKEAGCIEFKVSQRASELTIFDVQERFESRAAFDAHQARVKASKWGMVTINASRHYRIAEHDA